MKMVNLNNFITILIYLTKYQLKKNFKGKLIKFNRNLQRNRKQNYHRKFKNFLNKYNKCNFLLNMKMISEEKKNI